MNGIVLPMQAVGSPAPQRTAEEEKNCDDNCRKRADIIQGIENDSKYSEIIGEVLASGHIVASIPEASKVVDEFVDKASKKIGFRSATDTTTKSPQSHTTPNK